MPSFRTPRPARILAGFLAAALLAAQPVWAAPLQLNFPNPPPGGDTRLFLSGWQAANYAKQRLLAGITLSTGIGNIAKTGNASKNVLDGMWQGLKQGAVSVGLQFATENLDPTLGTLASTVVAGAIDGLISPPIERDAAGKPIIDPETGKPKLKDVNGDGRLDFRDNKGIFAGIAENVNRALGGFAEIGLIKPGDPVGNAQRLAQMNDFSTIIREQGLGAALDTYATGLLHRSSVESILNAGTSIRQYGTIKESINAALAPPNPSDTRPKMVVEEVEFEGKRVKQLLFLGDGGYLLFDSNTNDLIGIQEGDGFVRLDGSPKVDPTTGAVGFTDATFKRALDDGSTVTQKMQGGKTTEIEMTGPDGTKVKITPNASDQIRLNANGTIRDGNLKDLQSGATFYFQGGQIVGYDEPSLRSDGTPSPLLGETKPPISAQDPEKQAYLDALNNAAIRNLGSNPELMGKFSDTLAEATVRGLPNIELVHKVFNFESGRVGSWLRYDHAIKNVLSFTTPDGEGAKVTATIDPIGQESTGFRVGWSPTLLQRLLGDSFTLKALGNAGLSLGGAELKGGLRLEVNNSSGKAAFGLTITGGGVQDKEMGSAIRIRLSLDTIGPTSDPLPTPIKSAIIDRKEHTLTIKRGQRKEDVGREVEHILINMGPEIRQFMMPIPLIVQNLYSELDTQSGDQ